MALVSFRPTMSNEHESARPFGGSNSRQIKSCGGERTGRRQDEAPADEPTDAAAAAAAAAFIADVLPSRALRDLGAQILAKDAEDPDPETLMRRLQTGWKLIIN